MDILSRIPSARAVLLMLLLLHVQSGRSVRSYRSYQTYRYYYYTYNGSSGSTTDTTVGGVITVIMVQGIILCICWCCKKSFRSPCTRRRVIRTRNVTSPSPPRVQGVVNSNVTYTTKEDNIAHTPAVDPPKYEMVVKNCSTDSTGPYYGQPPPYPSTDDTDIHEQRDKHMTYDTAKLVKE